MATDDKADLPPGKARCSICGKVGSAARLKKHIETCRLDSGEVGGGEGGEWSPMSSFGSSTEVFAFLRKDGTRLSVRRNAHVGTWSWSAVGSTGDVLGRGETRTKQTAQQAARDAAGGRSQAECLLCRTPGDLDEHGTCRRCLSERKTKERLADIERRDHRPKLGAPRGRYPEPVRASVRPELSPRGFPLYEGKELSWDLNSYTSLDEEREGYPRMRAVVLALRAHRPEQLDRERRELLMANADRVFGHNARKVQRVIDEMMDRAEMIEPVFARPAPSGPTWSHPAPKFKVGDPVHSSFQQVSGEIQKVEYSVTFGQPTYLVQNEWTGGYHAVARPIFVTESDLSPGRKK